MVKKLDTSFSLHFSCLFSFVLFFGGMLLHNLMNLILISYSCEKGCKRSFHATVEDGEESECVSLGLTKDEVEVCFCFIF